MKKIKHYNIMLVEDEVLLRQSLARHIDALESGYKVVCQVPDGQAALEALRTEDIHLIITDIRMPVMDGLALAKNVHDRYPHILTIVLSGYADFEYAQEALRQGVFDYLLKPVSREKLESTLGKASLLLEKHFQLEEDTAMVGKDSQEIVDYVLLYIRSHYMDEVDFSVNRYYRNRSGDDGKYADDSQSRRCAGKCDWPENPPGYGIWKECI